MLGFVQIVNKFTEKKADETVSYSIVNVNLTLRRTEAAFRTFCRRAERKKEQRQVATVSRPLKNSKWVRKTSCRCVCAGDSLLPVIEERYGRIPEPEDAVLCPE